MSTCPKCQRNVFTSFGDGYDRCINCSTLVDVMTVPPPPAKAISKEYPNTAMCERIKAQITADWNELTSLREAGIAWATIITTKGYDFAATTIAKHYRDLFAIRFPDEPKRKRGRHRNYGVKQNIVKQECYTGKRGKNV